jgi:SOS-response transcriptional repressor LexA
MLESPKLTARQQQIFDLIQSAIARTGAPPTRAEIASELGFKSANAAEEHLQALARKGVIELVSGTSRGIRLKSDGDLLAVQATKDAKNGQIIVARLGEEVTVKRFRRNKHLIELHAENPDYQTIVVEPGEPFEVEGLAVGLIRNTMLM